jgi:hypothetical protein
MTIDEAINIAWGIGRSTGQARPTVSQALEIINEQLRIYNFNWLTGQAAKEVLQNKLTPTKGSGRK